MANYSENEIYPQWVKLHSMVKEAFELTGNEIEVTIIRKYAKAAFNAAQDYFTNDIPGVEAFCFTANMILEADLYHLAVSRGEATYPTEAEELEAMEAALNF